MKKVIIALGAPTPEKKKEPVSVRFHLNRHGHRWHIVEIGGELAPAVEAARKLRKLK